MIIVIKQVEKSIVNVNAANTTTEISVVFLKNCDTGKDDPVVGHKSLCKSSQELDKVIFMVS